MQRADRIGARRKPTMIILPLFYAGEHCWPVSDPPVSRRDYIRASADVRQPQELRAWLHSHAPRLNGSTWAIHDRPLFARAGSAEAMGRAVRKWQLRRCI